MSETIQNLPPYFNGNFGNGEAMKKLAETLLTDRESNTLAATDFDKHRNLLCGNPFVLTK
ncbi:hypothetical protein EHS13_32775 [Paenibacillus psychroresistens]|uniref:Uncharacterized protein n=1 Tax=Paenibacillus psychroresistens TaxID=1778678 RepID=A0A6B8RTR5_9BACL|nr:hypothetical protein [Paenibacillus psychroresistens]QGQ99299.1 hypothetical protein EHS13_32775 [Paenibacillus psychroresistens]